MTDIAKLVLDADTRGLKRGERELDKLGNQSRTTAREVDRSASQISGAFKRVAAAAVAAGLATVLYEFGKASAQAAIDAEEMNSAFDVVFGEMSENVRDWAEETGNAMGRSTQEIQRGALAFQELFGKALQPEKAAELSKRFAVLTQDLASFKNLSNEVAQQKLFSGLVGESEPLRAVGVFLSETAVQAKGLELGLSGVNDALTDQEKIVARAAIIQEQLSDAQGDVIRTSDSAANQIKTLNAAVEELQVAVGQKLLPALTPLVTATANVVNELADFTREAGTAGTTANRLMTAVQAAGIAWVSYRGTLLATSALTTIFTGRLALQTAAVLSSARAVGGLTAAKMTLGAAVTGVTGGLRALTAALIANPFTAVAVAVGTLASAFYLLGQRQREARAETDNLIRSLRGLAQARSSEFATARTAAQMELNKARDLLGAMEGHEHVPQSRLQQLRWDIVRLEGELTAADRAFKSANQAAEAMEAPVAQASGAVGGLSSSLKTAGGAARSASDDFADLMESLYPENITRRQMQQLKMIEMFADGIDNVTDARRRALNLPAANDNLVSRDLLGQGPLEEAKKVEEAAVQITEAFDKQVTRMGEQGVIIKRTFREISQDVTRSLQSLASSIEGGNFFDILTSVIDLLAQLGSIGLFGSSIARTLNSAPAFGGARADGGPVSSGKSYLVGERGPELFTPASSGYVHSNDNMGGKLDVTVTMDESTGRLGAFVRNQAGQVVAEAAPAIISAGGQSGVAQMNKLQQRRLG